MYNNELEFELGSGLGGGDITGGGLAILHEVVTFLPG
jgi:hypothetical protein